MKHVFTTMPVAARYELRFTSLFNRGRGFAFPCDASGAVEIDTLSERGRVSYLHARGDVGVELSGPIVALARDPGEPVRRTGQVP